VRRALGLGGGGRILPLATVGGNGRVLRPFVPVPYYRVRRGERFIDSKRGGDGVESREVRATVILAYVFGRGGAEMESRRRWSESQCLIRASETR